MNVWIFNHYAGSPDMQATRSYDLGREMVRRGHDVTIFASSYSHYRQVEERLAAGDNEMEEHYSGLRFVWLRTFAYHQNDWRRLLNVLTYAWRALVAGLRRKDRPDVLIGTCVHPLAPLVAYCLSKWKRGTFLYEVTDLWPQTLIDMEELSPQGVTTRVLRCLERFLFRRSRRIISLLPNVGEYLGEIGLPDKSVWIPNGVDLSLFADIEPYDGGRDYGFRFMYIGGHASYHRLEKILEAIAVVQDGEQGQAEFVFVGGGSEKPRLMELARELQLRNVTFRDAVPKNELYLTLGEADALLFSFRNLELLRYGVSPVKVFDYLCTGRPIIYSMKASNNPVAESGAGITIEPEDRDAWVDGIRRILAMTPAERIAMGRKGPEYVKKNHSIELLTDRLEHTLEQAC